jgi:hypothetical protein
MVCSCKIGSGDSVESQTLTLRFGAAEGWMRPREQRDCGEQDLFRSRLDQIIDMDHALVGLARTIDWRFLAPPERGSSSRLPRSPRIWAGSRKRAVIVRFKGLPGRTTPTSTNRPARCGRRAASTRASHRFRSLSWTERQCSTTRESRSGQPQAHGSIAISRSSTGRQAQIGGR